MVRSRSVAAFLLMTLLADFGCHSQKVSAGLELRTEDYSAARKRFQTHLIQHIAAPQRGEALQPPPGAVQIEYDAKRHLAAWMTPLSPISAAGGAKKPAVLFLHDGFAVGADDWDMTQPYRDAGFVVLMPVLRGENGQSGDYSAFYDEVDDVLAAADYLATRPDVEAGHISVAGHSVGGTLTLLAALSSSRFRAAASFSGAPDVIAWSKGQEELLPFDTSNKREFQMRSPIAFANSFKCPVRLFCGDAESLFVGASRETAARARNKGLDVKAVSVPGDHFSAVPEEIQQSIEFFKAKR